MMTLWAFVLAIALLVVVHELGHFWVARMCGVKVLRFSVGFGRSVYVRKFAGSDTEWQISAIPLGGYVKMLDEREGPVPEGELHMAFNRRPVAQRMAILVAGPVANFILAVILYWGLFMHGMPGLKPMLGEIAPQSPAAAAKLQAQETIVGVNGIATPSWQDVRWALLQTALQGAPVQVEGISPQGAVLHHVLDLSGIAPADLDGDFLQKLGLQPYQPPVAPVIGKLAGGGVAEQAGVRPGDRVTSIDGQGVAEWKNLVDTVRAHPGRPLRFQIARDGNVVELVIVPEAVDEAGRTIGRIGAAPEMNEREMNAMLTEVSYPPLAALAEAARKTQETAFVSLKMMGKMILGEISLKNLSGPISIADYAGQSAHMGWIAYLDFLALISISLGVLNLLPIPLLDGGHLLYYMVELVKGSPVSERAWEVGQNIGIALLVTLMAFALYNDISRLIFG